jgi:flavorubredoxin
MVSYDTRTATLFSSDLFGGFVPDARILVSHDLDYIIESARPFHQHYMPSTELLTAGLARIQQRWPQIRQIAPQHGHIIPSPLVNEAFKALTGIDCGVHPGRCGYRFSACCASPRPEPGSPVPCSPP